MTFEVRVIVDQSTQESEYSMFVDESSCVFTRDTFDPSVSLLCAFDYLLKCVVQDGRKALGFVTRRVNP